jgi:hypothetical protein
LTILDTDAGYTVPMGRKCTYDGAKFGDSTSMTSNCSIFEVRHMPEKIRKSFYYRKISKIPLTMSIILFLGWFYCAITALLIVIMSVFWIVFRKVLTIVDV